MIDAEDDWYEQAMLARETALITAFGPTSPLDTMIPPQDAGWEMRIPGFGYLKFPPTETRNFWLYVTHGLSQPQSEEAFRANDIKSEFAIATWESEQWPCVILEMLASYAIRSPRPIVPRDRLPVGDLMEENPGGGLLAITAPGYDPQIPTNRGKLSIVHLVGITASELARAKRLPGPTGSEVLEKALCAYNDIGYVTDRRRKSITTRDDFEMTWINSGGS